ncbi:MAG: glycosyltransferase family 4 protein [Thermoplasmata archaeon]|nr:glycosyltransferase family 4 protein [Thermoplasmata archaeon]
MKNLLIITSRYPHPHDSVSSVFVYSQIEELKNYFEKVVVISTTPYTPKVLSKKLEPKRKRDSLAEDYKYGNVEVYFTKDIVLPSKTSKQKKGKAGYKSVVKILDKINFDPDIIHAHFTWPSGYIAMELKKHLRKPFILTAHGYDVYDLPFRDDYYNDVVKNVLTSADHIITVSQNNKDILINKLNASPEKISIIQNGYDPKKFKHMDKKECRIKLGLPIDKKIVISIGNLLPVKGHIYLIEAAKDIIKERKDIVFVITGEGPERKPLENSIEEFGLDDYFILTGSKPHKQIPFWMGASDIIVLPSLNEGVPTVLFEAQASGKPVIGTSVGGIPDIINEEKLGTVVSPGDSGQLSTAILNASNKDWDENYIIKTSMEFTWDKIASQIMQIYTNILQNPKSNIEKKNKNAERGNKR